MKKAAALITTLMFTVMTSINSVSATKDHHYADDEDEYDYDTSEDTYYDGDGTNSTDYNYSYSYNYEEEEELNYVPELITRPQRIVVRQGENAELPCEANVRNVLYYEQLFQKLYKKDKLCYK